MASDGSAPQMNTKNKVMVALCFALMIILLNDGVEASANDAKPTTTLKQLPMRLRNPRGVGLAHLGERSPKPLHQDEPNSSKETEERESVPEDQANTIPRFVHLPPHMHHDPRGVRASIRPMEEEKVAENQVESEATPEATPEANQVRFSHLPRLHNPRGVNAVKQIQEGMRKDGAGDEGDKN